MTESRQDNIKKLIIENERRLQKLKQKKAAYGLDTPPQVLTEIEDIEANLEKLHQELATLESKGIAEPTLEYFVYYLRRAAGDNNSAIQERREAFAAELRALLGHLEQRSGQAIPDWDWPQERDDRRVSQRIVRTGWLDNLGTSRSYFVEARTYGDVYWLQAGYYQQGQTGPEIFPKLRDDAWHPSATDYFLGSSEYLCGIVAEEMDELARETFTTYTNDSSGPLLSTHLVDGPAWLFGASQHPDVSVLFYPNAESEKWAGQTVLNNVAPRFELYHHKASRQLSWCENAFQLLSEQDRLLDDGLKEIRQASTDDVDLLQSTIHLYLTFNGNFSMVAGRQTTIEIGLTNLDTVRQDLGSLVEDHYLNFRYHHLRQRQNQLEADLKYADNLRKQGQAEIEALRIRLSLDHLGGPEATPTDQGFFEQTDVSSGVPAIEAEIEGFTSHQRPPEQPITYPAIIAPHHMVLEAEEKDLLQQVYRGMGTVFVEKEFTSGYSGARVLLTQPIRTDEIPIARTVTKLSAAPDLRLERDNYKQYVGPFLPHSTARVEWDTFYEQNDALAGLIYIFMGGGSLGEVIDLAEFYRQEALDNVDRIVKTLNILLSKELGACWYSHTIPLNCFFAAEYGPRMIEHVRLRLRPESLDVLWKIEQPPITKTSHRQIAVEAIPRECEKIQANTLLSIEGMLVRGVKHNHVRLEDPEKQGIVVGVEIASEKAVPHNLKAGHKVGVRGEVVYNQQGRMKQIVKGAFSNQPIKVDGKSIQLPDVVTPYPNPLKKYHQVLGKILRGKQSYVHGDLHLHNILVDEWGKGWLIDFALVKRHHNIFDFIKIETSLRLMELAKADLTFSLVDYVQFEEALAAATLDVDGVPPPDNPHLRAAFKVILAIRRIARNYMANETGFLNEYFPALFLYCLSVLKYYQPDTPQPTRLVFTTASILLRHILL